MGIYERDYKVLRVEERIEYQRILEEEEKGMPRGIRKNLYHLYPKAVKHSLTLFPNNYLDPFDLREKNHRYQDVGLLESLLASENSNEREIIKLIADNQCYFVIGSILKKNYNFGHHSAFIFPEFPLGSCHRADYLLVGQNSDGYHFVFVEMESPSGKAVLSDGSYGKPIRAGINQTQDWASWLQGGFSSLHAEFMKHSKRDEALPKEFLFLERSRIHYVVVAGRREEFSEKTRELRRNTLRESAIRILHYDNLIDGAKGLIEENLTY